MRKLILKFNIDERVLIPEINTKGRVNSIAIYKGGRILYEVRYFLNDKLECPFLNENEIVKLTNKTRTLIGFIKEG